MGKTAEKNFVPKPVFHIRFIRKRAELLNGAK
jgi:hypothetical protein